MNGIAYARVHVLIAPQSQRALVLRRGPSKQTCVLSWNRKTDTFKVSQWLKGKIDPRKADISPRGTYWIYSGSNGKYMSDSMENWTAIAQVPWLKAIELWRQGYSFHGGDIKGGGIFFNERKFWLNEGYGFETLERTTIFERIEDDSQLPKQLQGEFADPYLYRLFRDGWRDENENYTQRMQELKASRLCTKQLSHGWKLIKFLGCLSKKVKYSSEGRELHELRHEEGTVLFYPDWEWVDWVDNSVVYSSNGCLYRQIINGPNDIPTPVIIHDFNDHHFEEKRAPY